MLIRLNPDGLPTEEEVNEFMLRMQKKNPDIKSWQFETDEEGFLNVLIWGDERK